MSDTNTATGFTSVAKHTEAANVVAFPKASATGDKADAANAQTPAEKIAAAGFVPPAVSPFELHKMLAACGFADFPPPLPGDGKLPPVAVYAGELLDVAPLQQSFLANASGFKAALAAAAMPGTDAKEAVATFAKAFKDDKARKAKAAKATEEAAKADAEGEDMPLDPQPWPYPVDGAQLFKDLCDRVRRHVGVPAGGVEAIALWLFFAHTLDAHKHSPRLGITSPSPGCGKTTTLELVGALSPRPLPASSITAASVFRSITAWSPTLLIDEADTYLASSDELRGILNAGHARSGCVVRTVGDDHTPKRFRVWCPMAIALIGSLPATLESRCVLLPLRRLAINETVEDLDTDPQSPTGAALIILHRKLARWAADNIDALRGAQPAMPPGFKNRQKDNWKPLLAIADLIGGTVPAEARAAALKLWRADAGQTTQVDLLADLRAIFTARRKDKLTTGEILTELAQMQDRPWSEYDRGKPITAYGLAKVLKPFGVLPKHWRAGSETQRGYFLATLRDAFDRYLPPLVAEPADEPETASAEKAASASGFAPLGQEDGTADPAEDPEHPF